jgi:hypothetical protein
MTLPVFCSVILSVRQILVSFSFRLVPVIVAVNVADDVVVVVEIANYLTLFPTLTVRLLVTIECFVSHLCS